MFSSFATASGCRPRPSDPSHNGNLRPQDGLQQCHAVRLKSTGFEVADTIWTDTWIVKGLDLSPRPDLGTSTLHSPVMRLPSRGASASTLAWIPASLSPGGRARRARLRRGPPRLRTSPP